MRKKLTGKESPLELYKRLVDLIAGVAEGVVVRKWVMERKSWPKLPENEPINKFLAKLSKEERLILVSMLQGQRRSGIHDVLAVLSEEANLEGLRFVQNGKELPNEPFGTEIYFDFVARVEGDEWPDKGA